MGDCYTFVLSYCCDNPEGWDMCCESYGWKLSSEDAWRGLKTVETQVVAMIEW